MFSALKSRITKKMVIVLASVGLMTGFAIAAPGTAQASDVPVAVAESNGGPTIFMNRQGGGHVYGTHVIGYLNRDANTGFSFYFLGTWCGDGHVHGHGESCPFANGSGLNDRYDGSPIYALHSYDTGFFVAIPSFSGASGGKTTLGNYGDNGYAWVRNSAGYVVSVGESNYKYTNGGGYNKPYWLQDEGADGAQLVAAGPANNGTWYCDVVSGQHRDSC